MTDVDTWSWSAFWRDMPPNERADLARAGKWTAAGIGVAVLAFLAAAGTLWPVLIAALWLAWSPVVTG